MPASFTTPFQSRGVAPGQLPVLLTSLIGREHEVPQVMGLLDRDDVRLVTLPGPGGVGKTRLAQEVATLLAPSFAHGAWFVSLESVLNPDQVPKTVARALGLRESIDRPAPELIVEYLSGLHMLLVLDNFEQVISASGWISDLLAQMPRLRLLVTSRTPLHIRGEQEFMVPTLTISDEYPERSAPVSLFQERARAVNFAFAPDEAGVRAIAEVCRRLDGLPLAIEMAAAWMKTISPETLLDRLEDRLGILSGSSRDVHPRLQSMSQAIAWSYDLLSHDERVLLCRLSMFSGGISLEAAEFVAQWPQPPGGNGRALSVLQSLVDQSLVQAVPGDGHPPFRMLETIREFARRRVAEAGDESPRNAHASYYQNLAERAEYALTGPEQARWLDLLEREYPNLQAAMFWLEQSGRLLEAIEIYSRIQFFINIRGHTVEALERYEAWLDSPELLASSLSRGLVLMGMGRLYQNTGDLERSVAMLTEAAAIFLALEDQRHAAMARGMLASGYGLMGLPDEMAEMARQALDLAKPLKMHRTVGAALSVLSWHSMLTGDREQAEALQEESSRIATEAGDRWAMSFILVYRARVSLEAGRLDEAKRYAEQWRHLLEELGSLHDLPNAWVMLAWVARRQGNLQTAAEHLEQANAIALASANQRLVSFISMRAGIVAAEQGRFRESAALLSDSIGRRGIDQPQLLDLSETLDAFAALAAQAGDAEQAARFLGATSRVIEEVGISREYLEFDAQGFSFEPSLQNALGDAEYELAFAAGASLDPAAALAEAQAYSPAPVEDPVSTTSGPSQAVTLSPRELDVLRHMANGLTNQQIADELFLSLRTVTTHVTRILDKLRVSSRTAAVPYAIRHDLV